MWVFCTERERERECVCSHACFAECFSCVFLQRERERERERERVCVCVLRRDGVEVGEGCETRTRYIVILKQKQAGEWRELGKEEKKWYISSERERERENFFLYGTGLVFFLLIFEHQDDVGHKYHASFLRTSAVAISSSCLSALVTVSHHARMLVANFNSAVASFFCFP